MMVEPKHFESLYPVDTRSEEIEKIVGFIREGNSCQIIGLPGVGRSNLLGMLAYNREIREKHFPTKNEWVHFVMVDFSELRNRPLVDVIKLFSLSLTDSLRERNMTEEHAALQKIFQESASLQDELVMFQGLKRAIDYLSIEKKRTIIFLFDRFEEYIKSLTPSFFTNMRILRNRAKYRFSIVFSLSRPLEDLLEPQLFADFHEFVVGHLVYLSIKDEVGLRFRISYLEKLTDKAVEQKIKDEVLQLTAGHGKLTRLSLEALLASSNVISSDPALQETRVPIQVGKAEGISHSVRNDKEILNQVKDDKLLTFLLTQKTVRGGLYEIWNALLPTEQEFLSNLNVILGIRQLAETPESDKKRSWTSYNPVKGQDDVITGYLEHVGLLKENTIQIPLLAEMISTQQFVDTSKEKIVFDSETNTLKKGYTVLSDTLTSAEFRLLKYLIQNPEKIIERDEIINVVWQESKSTAGVTDQAIDQLIFRLRRKIEDDPNAPVHLQTAKGRGFRFTA